MSIAACSGGSQSNEDAPGAKTPDSTDLPTATSSPATPRATETKPTPAVPPTSSSDADDDDGNFANLGPVVLPAGARLEKDVAYGSDPLQRFDVYIPEGAANAPVLLMVHGGGWRRGDKGAFGVVQNKVNHYLPKGYIVISTNYRLVPQVDPVVEAEDVAAALAFAQQHAAQWGADPSRFVLMGHSAGAHLVTEVSAVPEIWQKAGAKPWLGTIPLDSGAYNVVQIMEQPHLGLYDTAFGKDRALWEAASPTLRLKGPTPPMLLVCSSRRAISCGQSNAFADRANSLGGSAKVMPVDMSHGEINLNVGVSGSYTDGIDAFLKSLGLN